MAKRIFHDMTGRFHIIWVRYKYLLLGGVALVGAVAMTAWVLFLGPAFIVPHIANHDRATVEWFCRLGVSPNREAWLHGGVFHCAVAGGDTNIVVMMLERGADINRLDGYGVTPLDVAAQGGDVAMMKLLVSHGADVSRPDREGATALALAERDNLEAPRRYLLELATGRKAAN